MSPSWMADPKSDPHTFHRLSWKPDVALLTEDQLGYLTLNRTGRTQVDAIIYLVSHKSPTLSVLEISLNGDNTSSLWFDHGGRGTELACFGQ
jgi:hypothetical protein